MSRRTTSAQLPGCPARSPLPTVAKATGWTRTCVAPSTSAPASISRRTMSASRRRPLCSGCCPSCAPWGRTHIEHQPQRQPQAEPQLDDSARSSSFSRSSSRMLSEEPLANASARQQAMNVQFRCCSLLAPGSPGAPRHALPPHRPAKPEMPGRVVRARLAPAASRGGETSADGSAPRQAASAASRTLATGTSIA